MNRAGKRARKKTPLKRTIQQWINYNVGVPLAFGFIKGLLRTWKVRRVGVERQKLKPAIFAIWHGDLVIGAMELKHLLPGVDVLASRSRDGSLVARFVHLNRARTIRGGSSSGASSALLQMRRSLVRGRGVVIPVDGPRGPVEVVKPGVIAVASQTGAPIIAGAVLADRAWRFKSWDAAFVAKPFARVTFVYDDPLYVAENASREQIEEYRLKLEQRLKELHKEHAYPSTREPVH